MTRDWCRICNSAHPRPHCRDPGRKRKRYAPEFRALTALIKERDAVERESYNADGKEKPLLVVHHIDENGDNNVPTNLITLCHDCHNTHHKSKYSPFRNLSYDAQRNTDQASFDWHARYGTTLGGGYVEKRETA